MLAVESTPHRTVVTSPPPRVGSTSEEPYPDPLAGVDRSREPIPPRARRPWEERAVPARGTPASSRKESAMRNRSTVVAAATLLLVLGACSDDEPTSTGPTSPTGATETTEPSPSPTDEETPEPTESEEPTETDSPEGGRETELETEDSSLGTIITDADGVTLYVFLNDTEGESTACTGDCADSWPALIVRGELEAGGDVDESLLGTVDHPSGSMQATYAGRPLYYFAGDEQPGDTNGQGLGEVWFVVSPSGEPIEG
jgi:predicted lipoprotein with Yx(FWY)xxD motif